jgi:hypothetical protein
MAMADVCCCEVCCYESLQGVVLWLVAQPHMCGCPMYIGPVPWSWYQ